MGRRNKRSVSILEYIPKNTRNILKNTIEEVSPYIKTASEAYDAFKTLESQSEFIKEAFINSSKQGSAPTGINPRNQLRARMPRRRRSGKPRRANRRRNAPGYLRFVSFPIKDTIPWANQQGTTGKWLFHVTLEQLVKPFITTFDEFRVVKLQARYCPNNSEGAATGNFAGVLMDQSGFGDFGSAKADAWFLTLASFPGSKVTHRGAPMVHHWVPTEPDSRNWRSYQRSELKYVVCTLYYADNGKETVELGGCIVLSGKVQARGRYYNVPTLQHAMDKCRQLAAQPEEGFEEVNMY